MEKRLPLTLNKQLKRIEELPTGDYIDLSTSGITDAETIESKLFYGDLIGVASTAKDVEVAPIDENQNFFPIFVRNPGGISYEQLYYDGSLQLSYNPSTNSLGIGVQNPTKTLEVGGDALISGELLVSGSTTLEDTLEVEEATTLNSTLEVTGKATLNNELEVEEATTLNSTLTVEGKATLNNELEVEEATTLNSTLEVTGKATLNNELEVEEATTLNSTLTVEGKATLNNELEVEEATTLNSTLEVTGKATLNNELEVEGVSLFNDTTESTSSETGAVQIKGGVGIEKNLNVKGDITVEPNSYYYGEGERIVGIVTQIVSSIGINIADTQSPGKGVVTIDAYTPVGRVIYVSMNGDDNNTGLAENHTKRTIKSASFVALPGDTIKVFPGSYVEENPIVLAKGVSVEGSELRNVTLTPRYLDRDFFYLNDGCHITDVSFIGPDVSNGAAIVAFEALSGVESGRYFDAARMIRQNLDFIASETVGYITSTDYRPGSPFVLGIGTDGKCKEDIKSIWKSICFDITRGGNSRSIGAGVSYYDGAVLQHIVGVKTETIDAIQYSVGIARSVVNNVKFEKDGGGNYQLINPQVRDLSIPADPDTLSNADIGSCANVLSSITVCAGIVTNIIASGPSALGGVSGIKTTFPGNSGVGFSIDDAFPITNAVYDNTSGITTITSPSLVGKVVVGERLEIRDLEFSCSSNPNGPITTQLFPSGAYGYEFYIDKINEDGSVVLNVGVSTIPHNYEGGGYIVNRSIEVDNAVYDNVTGIVTITAPGAYVRNGDLVRIVGLGFTCPSGPGIVTYPSGNLGYDFRVNNVIGFGNTFSTFVGTSTLPHTYTSGGVVKPPYSKGVGNILKGPYVRNCTNFIGKSIGMKVDGFEAEPGDADDVGVTGAMSVDSYTQYNQGGIGVSITNGSYCQLVSIFTICDEVSIYTGSGGQCDITNSNTSFGNFGLISEGVGDNTTKSVYRYTGEVLSNAVVGQDTVVIANVGNNRPYDGQAIYFGELYYTIQRIDITNPGENYNQSTGVIIELPQGENGIPAEALANIVDGKITSVDLVSSGTQFTQEQVNSGIGISFTGIGTNAVAVAVMEPTYYNIESATLPSAGISTIVLTENLNNTVSIGTTVYFSRLSLQIASSHSFEWVGAGNDIFKAKPGLGGVAISENEVLKIDGGQIVYTSTDQAGNFKIGDDVVINQLTGTISGRAFDQSLLNTVTPIIIAIAN